MKKIFYKWLLWIYIKVRLILLNIGFSMYTTELDSMNTTNLGVSDRNSIVQVIAHKHAFIDMMLKGVKDEKLVSQYYELLKKADKFMLKSSPHKIHVTADKYSMSYGKEDKYGRTYEHYGFFDSKHKNAGKSLEEVLNEEIIERKTNDDNLKIIAIYNNYPIETGFSKVLNIVEENDNVLDKAIVANNDENKREFLLQEIGKRSEKFEFPIKVYRDKESINRIEQLTEFLHVKMIGFEYRQLEFFIPLKFGTEKIEENSEIFNDISNIKYIFVKNSYGEQISYTITKFLKRINYNNTHEVWKFEATEMQDLGVVY